jgi:hypothetical protein
VISLRRSDHRGVQALEKDLRDWVTTWNENPKPFIWTKTADQILKSLGDYRNELTTQDTKTSESFIVYAHPARATGRCCPTWEERS